MDGCFLSSSSQTFKMYMDEQNSETSKNNLLKRTKLGEPTPYAWKHDDKGQRIPRVTLAMLGLTSRRSEAEMLGEENSVTPTHGAETSDTHVQRERNHSPRLRRVLNCVRSVTVGHNKNVQKYLRKTL